jgi:6-phosphogluconate dehydrogenase
MSKCDFGLIGLAVMGQNLVLNAESKGFSVAVYNRTEKVTSDFLRTHKEKNIVGAKKFRGLCVSPRASKNHSSDGESRFSR